jgi:transcriptional regulator with XRE-family HTH domain
VRANDPDSILRDIGRRIAEVRIAQHLTQEAFAERLDVTARYVQRVEGGGQNVSVRVLASFATALGIPIAELFRKPSAIAAPRTKRRSARRRA